MSKARKRHTRKVRRLDRARRRSKKKIVRHKCLKGRTGTAHSKTTRPKCAPGYRSTVAATMASASLHCCG